VEIVDPSRRLNIAYRPRDTVMVRLLFGFFSMLSLDYQMKAEKDQTFVLFTHANWKKPVEFMHHCSTKWAIFLLSLKDWLERDEGRPSPYDIKIHVGD
jgi:hypothetical protein